MRALVPMTVSATNFSTEGSYETASPSTMTMHAAPPRHIFLGTCEYNPVFSVPSSYFRNFLQVRNSISRQQQACRAPSTLHRE